MRQPARFVLGLALLALPCISARAAEIPVEGQVFGVDGGRLPGVQVELRPVLSRYGAGSGELEGRGEPAPVARVATDVMGRFRLSAPKTGLWQVVAVADGYVPMEISALPVLEETGLSPVRLRPDSGLRVRLVDPDGHPVAGARVVGQTGRPQLWSASCEWQPSRRLATSGPEGTLRLARAVGEPLRLWAAGPGFPAQGGSLANGRETVLRLQPGEQRSVMVHDAEDRPVPEALLRDPGSSLVLGRFDGQHPLALAAPTTSLWDLRVELADGRRMSFRLDEAQRPAQTLPLPLRLTPAVPLAGRIVDAAGRHCLAGALVWAADDPGSVTQTDAAGAYRLTDRVPGSRFDLRAAAVGHKPGQLKVGLPSRSPQGLRQAPDLPLVWAPVPAISGLVMDEAARPVTGAEIRLVRREPQQFGGAQESWLARTSPDGSFRIAPLQPGGLYALTANRSGFAPATLFVAVPLLPRSRPPIRLALTRGQTASGLVLDPRQRPIPGAAVKLTVARPELPWETQPALGPFRVETGADGRFRIPDLPTGVFELSIEGPEMAPLPAKVISVPKGEGLLNLGTFTLEGRSRIAGWIVNPHGRPVEGAEIWVVAEESTNTSQAARQAGPAAVTGPDGRFELRDRSVGDHEKLRACHKGYMPAEFQAQGPAATQPRVALTPSIALAGRVMSAGGEPLAGARVYTSLSGQVGGCLILPDPPCPFEDGTIAGADGAFTLEVKGPGRYDVSARGAGHLTATLEHLLVPPDGLDGVEIRMDGGTVVTGHVADPTGHAVAGATISLSTVRSYSDSDGDYLLEGVEPGEQWLVVEHSDYETVAEYVQIQATGTRLDLTLVSSPLEIRGRVSDPDGAPVEGAIISSSSESRTSTGADGSFVLPVQKGAHNLLAEKDGFAAAQIDGVMVEDRSLDGLEIRLGHGLTLTGYILGVDPAAVTGNSVFLMNFDSRDDETQAPIDSAGRFEIPNLSPGKWRLSAQAGNRTALVQFTPPAGLTEVVHDLEFPPVSEVRGQVTGPGGEPIEGASLQFYGGPDANFRTQTLMDGSFAVDLPDGTYTLSASAAGYSGRETQRPVVVAGEPVADVEIKLGTDIVLTGRLLGLETGDTLENLQIKGPPMYHTGAWTVDHEGHYRQTGLWPGDWTVKATFLSGFLERFATGRAHIPRGATEATLDLDFHVGDLTLRVRSTTPDNSFSPVLQNADGSELMPQARNENGTSLFPHLQAGTYRLSYQKGNKRQDQLVELTADREVVVDPAAP